MHFIDLGKPLLQHSWLSVGSSLPTTSYALHGLGQPSCVPNDTQVTNMDWDNLPVYPMILKLLITKGYITLIPREATQEKENDNLKMQPEKVKKKEKQEKIKKEND